MDKYAENNQLRKELEEFRRKFHAKNDTIRRMFAMIRKLCDDNDQLREQLGTALLRRARSYLLEWYEHYDWDEEASDYFADGAEAIAALLRTNKGFDEDDQIDEICC